MIISKKVIILTIFVTLLSVATSTFRITLNDFARRLYDLGKQWYTNDQSFTVGPLTAHIALGILYFAGNLQIKTEIGGFNALFFQPGNLPTSTSYQSAISTIRNIPNTNNVEFRIASALFLDDQLPTPSLTYSARISSIYGATIKKVPFTNNNQAADDINAWASSNSQGLISDFISAADITSNTLVSASFIYLNGNWRNPFKPIPNKSFFPPGGAPAISHQCGTRTATYRSHEFLNYDFKAIEIPYANGRLSMMILLPINGKTYVDVETTIQGMTDWKANIFDYLKLQLVALTIPFFTFDVNSDYQTELKLNTPTLWGNPDLNGIFGPQQSGIIPFTVRIINRARVVVHPGGTIGTFKAREIFKKSVSPFDVDIPFVFMIKTSKDEVLLVGRYTGI